LLTVALVWLGARPARGDAQFAPLVQSVPIASAAVGVPYRYQVVALAFPLPQFALDDGPPGMTIDRALGIITWTPTAPGPVTVEVRVWNTVVPDALQRFTIQVAPGLDGGMDAEADAAPVLDAAADAGATSGGHSGCSEAGRGRSGPASLLLAALSLLWQKWGRRGGRPRPARSSEET
jgi:hypothetical protein